MRHKHKYKILIQCSKNSITGIKFTHVTGTQKCEYTCFQNILTSFSIGGREESWEERGNGSKRKGKEARGGGTILIVHLRGFHYKMIYPIWQALSLNLGGKYSDILC